VKRRQLEERAATSWPISFAIGIAVLLVGLIVNPFVIASLGGAITLIVGFGWVRGAVRTRRPATSPAQASAEKAEAERFPRSRLLERATLGLGGLVALGVALPAIGFAVLPSFLGQRRRAVDLGPLGAFPEGQFVVATFLSDPQAGEISRRAAYSGTGPASRSCPAAAPTSAARPSRTGRCSRSGTSSSGRARAKWGSSRRCRPAASAAPATAASSTPRANTAGPAPRALDRYQFSIRRGHLWLEGIYSVSRVQGSGATARIHSFKRLGDGEPATGPESLLYPLDPIS